MPRRAMTMAGPWLALLALFGGAVVVSAAAAPPPLADCSVSFNDLTPCIDFVNSNSSGPPSSPCCTAFSTTKQNHPECLCQLQQAFADPATAPGNVTRAAQIPSLCRVVVDYNKCAALLGLAPQPAPATTPAPVVPPPTHPTLPPRPAPVQSPAPPTGKDYDCTNSFTDLSSCLGFVSGDGGKGAPPKECCTALANTQAKEPICICQLLAQVNDSAQYGVNATLAMELPGLCHVNGDTSKCPTLLNSPLAPSPTLVPTQPPSPIAPVPAHAPVPEPAPASGPVGDSVDCSNEFALLQSCFAYVMANDTAPPTVECCTSLGSVVTNKPVCLCQLLQTVGSGDPATSGINATRALGLADVCKVTTDVSQCPALLGQPVASPLPSSPASGEAPGASPAGGVAGEAPVAESPIAEALTPAPSSAERSHGWYPFLITSFWSVGFASAIFGC